MKNIYYAILIALLLSFTTSFAQEWTILETFEVPGKASGLAWDGQYIYFGQYSTAGNEIHRLDPETGNYEFVCYGPMEDAYGLTWDGQYLWSTDHPGSYDPGIAYQFDLSGATNYQFECPATYMGGIAYDAGLFWLAAYSGPDGHIFLTDDQGTVLKDFPAPGDQPWDICLQDEFLWIANYWEPYMLHKVDTIDGTLIESHPSEGQRPAGIVYDGQYMWYVDGPLSSPSTIYKVDLGGVGTPEISVPVSAWDYGNVAIGDSAVFNMVVSNIGTAPLEVEYIAFPGSAPIFNWTVFPQTIDPGNSIEIPLIYKPQEVGPLNVTVTIYSNDPVTPEVEVTLTGEGVISGPSIHVPVTSYSFGYVRVKAFTRWFMQIENVGDDVLIINEIESDETTITIDENIIFPLSISPLETIEVGVWFSPPTAITYTGILEIPNNDMMNPVVEVSVGGTGLETDYPIGSQFWQYTINTGGDNSAKAIALIQDISGDSVGDIIVCSEDDFIRCFNGNANNSGDILWEYEVYSGSLYQQAELFIAEDIDGDGFQEVVVGTTGGDRSVRMISGKTGELIWTFASSYWGDGGWVYAVDASRDHNGDGVPDVLACAGDDSGDTGPNRAFCLDGTNGDLLWNTPREGPGFGIICIEDVNGDGNYDVLFGTSNNSETEGKVKCLDGQNGALIWQKTTPGSSVWGLVQLDDINDDGVQDVAIGDFQGNFLGFDGTNGDEFFSGSVGSGKIINSLIRLDDVNEDGYADFTVGSGSTNCVMIDGYNGTNIWLKPLADQCSKVDRIADISGDGINDVIAGTLYSNNYVYFLDGVNGEELESIAFGEAVDAISSIYDINGDGSMEVVAGGRNGKVVCYSGGLDAWTSMNDHPAYGSFFNIQTNPNPFIDKVTVSIEASEEISCSINIFSVGGKLIKSFGTHQLSKGVTRLVWDGKDQSGANTINGLYLMVISDGNHIKTIRIIKQ